MEWIDHVADILASSIEVAMMLVLAIGALRALKAIAIQVIRREALAKKVREIWLHFAGWLVLALEFALAADLIRTVIEPSWQDIGQLAAIGAIRTALAWFLGKDIEEYSRDPAVEKAEG